MTNLHIVLRDQLHLSDQVFAAKIGRSRLTVWKIRTGGCLPSADTAERILSALSKLGVEMTLAELLSKPKRRRKAA